MDAPDGWTHAVHGSIPYRAGVGPVLLVLHCRYGCSGRITRLQIGPRVAVTRRHAVVVRKRRPDGWLIMFTATWYGGARFLEDFARTGTATYLGLRGTQWVSIVIIVAGAYFLTRLSRRGTVTFPAVPSEDRHDELAPDDMVSEGSPIQTSFPIRTRSARRRWKKAWSRCAAAV